MANRELPVIITESIASKPGELAKAIMMDLSHLLGEQDYTARRLSGYVGGTSGKDEKDDDSGSAIYGGFVEDLIDELAVVGVAPADGDIPSETVGGLRVIGGVGDAVFLEWDTITNSSPVEYKVYAHTSTFDPDVVPAADKYVGSWLNPGISAGNGGAYVLRVFPPDHALEGQVVSPGTTYYFMVIPFDQDGPAEGPHPVTSGTSIQIDSTHIGPNSILTPMLAANQILSAHIATVGLDASVIKFGQMSGDRITAGTVIAADVIGLHIVGYDIDAASITGGTIVGTIYHSANGGTTLTLGEALSGSGTSEIIFHQWGTLSVYGRVYAGTDSIVHIRSGFAASDFEVRSDGVYFNGNKLATQNYADNNLPNHRHTISAAGDGHAHTGNTGFAP